MSEHVYRLLVGSLMLVLLYTENYILAYLVIAMALFEGVTNQRLNLVVTRLRKKLGADVSKFITPPQRKL